MLSITSSKTTLLAIGIAFALSGSATAEQFRLSTTGGLGDNSFYTEDPAVAFNTDRSEFLAVWDANEVSGQAPYEREKEIFGRRISSDTGLPLGPQFRLTNFGPDGDVSQRAGNPAVAYNPDLDQYLLVFSAFDSVESEIYGLLLDGTGNPLGDEFRLSDMGPDLDGTWSAFSPDVVYNPNSQEYYAVWGGSDDVGGRVPGEYEIYGQRVTNNGLETGQNDIRISDMGPVGDSDFDAVSPSLAYDAVFDRYVVVWSANDDQGALTEDEFEIYLQLLHSSQGVPLLSPQWRISAVGGLGVSGVAARQPEVAINSAASEYLVLWRTCQALWGECRLTTQRIDAITSQEVGSDDHEVSPVYVSDPPSLTYLPSADQYLAASVVLDDGPPAGIGSEIFGFRLSAEGSLVGSPVRQSTMGIGTGGSYEAEWPALAVDYESGAVLFLWAGDHNEGGQVDDEYEIFGSFVGLQIFADGLESGDFSAWSAVSN